MHESDFGDMSKMTEQDKTRWLTLNDELNVRKVKNFRVEAEVQKKKNNEKKAARVLLEEEAKKYGEFF